MKKSKVGTRVGILGSGQLARMLALSAHSMGLEPYVLVKSEKDPAAQVCRNVVFSIKELIKNSDVIGYENEFVDADELKRAAKALKKPNVFLPKIAAIETLQDKISQKKKLVQLRIPTSPYVVWKNSTSLDHWLMDCRKKLGNKFVIKWAKYGYDGKGTFFYSKKSNLSRVREFVELGIQKQSRIFAEKLMSFKNEVAIIGVYSTTKEFSAYPLVVTYQKSGVCASMYGSLKGLDIKPSEFRSAVIYAKRLAQNLNLFGSFAIEFFQTRSGLVVNEIAPRVHNSGHYTLNCTFTSQFENHWRGLLGLPLGKTTPTNSFFGMVNLLGMQNVRPSSKLLVAKNLYWHWYGKSSYTYGRKMGHINIVADSKAELMSRLKELENL